MTSYWRDIAFPGAHPDDRPQETHMQLSPERDRLERLRRDALRAEEAGKKQDGVITEHGTLDLRKALGPRHATHELAGTSLDAGAFVDGGTIPAEAVSALYGLPPRAEDPGESPEQFFAREARDAEERGRIAALRDKLIGIEREKTKAGR